MGRAMGIEPKLTALQGLQNTTVGEEGTAACNWRANFRAMQGIAGLFETPAPFAIRVPLSIPVPSAMGQRSTAGRFLTPTETLRWFAALCGNRALAQSGLPMRNRRLIA
jgi:hypothetical protein